MDTRKALLTCRIANLARSHGWTRDDDSQTRAAALFATDTPSEFLSAMLPAVEEVGLSLREVFPDRDIKLGIDRAKPRVFRWTLPFYWVTETWPGAYEPSQVLAQSLLMRYHGDDPAVVESETSIANGRQYLIWDEAWGSDANMREALQTFRDNIDAARAAAN